MSPLQGMVSAITVCVSSARQVQLMHLACSLYAVHDTAVMRM